MPILLRRTVLRAPKPFDAVFIGGSSNFLVPVTALYGSLELILSANDTDFAIPPDERLDDVPLLLLLLKLLECCLCEPESPTLLVRDSS